MNINLATIDFCPGQGGGGEAVIRELNVTENGTYRAPSGVDGYNPVQVRVSGGGSVTPEEQAALDTLVNSSKGALYTDEYAPYVNYRKSFVFTGSSWVYRQVWLNDGLYTTSGQYMYKYNPDKCCFEEFRFFDNYFNSPVWQDMTGRTYCGVSYQLDFENNTFISVSLNAGSYVTSEQRHNIWKGQYGVYRLGFDPVKFDEENQEFVSWDNVNMPSGKSLVLSSTMAQYGFWYEGHFVYVETENNNNVMYELKEYSDHIDIEEVQDPYFPLTYTTEDQALYLICWGSFISLDSHLIWHYSDINLKIVDGQWERIHIYSDTYQQEEDYASYIPFTGYGDFIFGWNCSNQNFHILNVSDDAIKVTMWSDISGIAVDLKSNQVIRGYKTFNDGIQCATIRTSNIQGDNNNTYFELNANQTTASSIKLNTPLFMLNDNNVATTDQLFMNRQCSVYGQYLTPVVHQVGLHPGMTNYFSTYTGRVFYSDSGPTYLEWDGSGWNTLAGQKEVNVYNYFNGYVVNTPNATFYSYNSYTYLWDDSASDFVELCQNLGDGLWTCWWDGTNLRYNDSYKLVENGGVWSWVADTPIPDFKNGMYHYVNSKVYCLCFSDNGVYEYDPSLQTYTKLGYWSYWSQTSFVAGGDIIFPYNGSEYRKIDFSKVTPAGDQFIDTPTVIPYYDYDRMYCEHQGKLLMASNWDEWRYCYGIEESAPEVPAANGTYTLKAVRSGDTVTYSWVLDV